MYKRVIGIFTVGSLVFARDYSCKLLLYFIHSIELKTYRKIKMHNSHSVHVFFFFVVLLPGKNARQNENLKHAIAFSGYSSPRISLISTIVDKQSINFRG